MGTETGYEPAGDYSVPGPSRADKASEKEEKALQTATLESTQRETDTSRQSSKRDAGRTKELLQAKGCKKSWKPGRQHHGANQKPQGPNEPSLPSSGTRAEEK